MLEYFEEQLKTDESLTKDAAQKMLERAIANNPGDEEYYTEYYNSKVGLKKLYFMVYRGSDAEIKSMFEDEIDNYLGNGFTYIQSHGLSDNNKIPAFEYTG